MVMGNGTNGTHGTNRTGARARTIVGIDLGTTFSVVAHVNEHGKPEVVLNNDNQPTTASAVFIGADGNAVVGQLARDMAIASPENVIVLVKRVMGKDVKLAAAGREFTPEQVSAYILKKLKQDAENRLSRPVTDAVITIPAWFGADERKATLDAGEIAGFTVHHTLNEPTAAAIAYGFDNPTAEQTLLVYDLGGGTFDVTLLKVVPNPAGGVPTIEMVSTNGQRKLGGADWDERIMGYVAEQFQAKYGADPRDDLASRQDLYTRCEKAKISLSKMEKAKIVCQHAGQSLVVELDRARLLDLTGGLLGQTADLIDQLIEETRIVPDDIHQVLLAGGSTRLVMVRELLAGKFPGKVNTSLDPDLCVAQGAAWMGHLLAGGVRKAAGGGLSVVRPSDVVKDVCSHALGVLAFRNDEQLIFPLIAKDTTLPCGGQGQFYTREDNQESVEIAVYENDVRTLEEALGIDSGRRIGHVTLTGLPRRPRGQPLEVTFAFDTSFQLHVTARDIHTGKTVQGTLEVGSRLTRQTKEAARRELAGAVVES
jgi:molecular chaperone DnaK